MPISFAGASVELHLLLPLVGFVGGFVAGWVGLGGGIIVAPMLLYVPPAVGLEPLGMKEVARLTIVLSLFSTASAALAHRRARQVNHRLVVWAGATVLGASFVGAALSERDFVSCDMLRALVATMALGAAMLLFVSSKANDALDAPEADRVSFSLPRAALVAASVGFVGGLVGQSGAFLTIPLLIHALRLPVRVAIGSSLGISFCAALAGSFGKLIGGGPMSWPHVVALSIGSLLGSRIGSVLNHRQPTQSLRYVLASLIALSGLWMWYDVVT